MAKARPGRVTPEPAARHTTAESPRGKVGRSTPEPARSPAVAGREAAQKSALRPGARFRVEALHTGYYGEKRWREGDVFTYTLGPKESKLPKWVKPVPARTPGQLTSGKEILRRQHDEILASRMPAQGSMLVDDEPGAVEDPLGE